MPIPIRVSFFYYISVAMGEDEEEVTLFVLAKNRYNISLAQRKKGGGEARRDVRNLLLNSGVMPHCYVRS
jgi:hypothetical protein